MASGVSRDRRREAQWRGILEDQRRSGLSIRAFCREVGVTESAFYFWRRELARRRREREPEPRRTVRGGRQAGVGSPAGFVPVVVTAAPPAPPSPRIEIVSPGGWRVRVGAAVDRTALAVVLAAVAGVGGEHGGRLDAPVGSDTEGRPC